jgi:hypothetical protein
MIIHVETEILTTNLILKIFPESASEIYQIKAIYDELKIAKIKHTQDKCIDGWNIGYLAINLIENKEI